MKPLIHRTKIVATIGPASRDPAVIRQMMLAGMNVARLNFSHGTHADHAEVVQHLRSVAAELDLPLMLLQDLQGPKIRVGQLSEEGLRLQEGDEWLLVPLADWNGTPQSIGIDYPHVAEEAQPGAPVLLDDGLLELQVMDVQGAAVRCQVVKGGRLTSHKGVNFPSLNLRLPSMTEKDERDLEFGLSQGIDLVSLSFVRHVDDIRQLKQFLRDRGSAIPVLAKIEKPQAVQQIEAILPEVDAVMVARGDLGVEMRPEKVPLIQKQIIQRCNQKGIPVITATQMLDSMIHNPRPTRAEASDVANAIIDGTDAVMLSGESAVGQYPVEAIKMLARIATEVEAVTNYVNYPPDVIDATHAITEALNVIDQTLDLQCIVAYTTTGYSAKIAAGERPRAPVIGLTPDPQVYNQLSLVWGVRPVLFQYTSNNIEHLLEQIEAVLVQRQFAQTGDMILMVGGIPHRTAGSTNYLKIHTIGQAG